MNTPRRVDLNNIGVPTIEDIASALGYITDEFDIEANGGLINSEMWAEGLAFARYDTYFFLEASKHFAQLLSQDWSHIRARADYMRACDGFAHFDELLHR